MYNAVEDREKAEEVLSDRNATRRAATDLIEHPENLRQSMNAVQSSPALRRYAAMMSHDPTIRQNVRATSAKDKKKIRKSAVAGDSLRQTEGTKIVMMTTGRKFKSVFYPLESKIKGWIRVTINDTFCCLYDPEGGDVNKKASIIAGKDVRGDVYFFKWSGCDPMSTTIEEITSIVHTN